MVRRIQIATTTSYLLRLADAGFGHRPPIGLVDLAERRNAEQSRGGNCTIG